MNDGEIIGLDPDYTSLRGNKDQFELHLRNLVNKNFGKVFATTHLGIEFPIIGDAEICKIDVKRGGALAFIEIVNKHGQKSKKFYVRSGNSSQGLQIEEASEYIKDHFNNH